MHRGDGSQRVGIGDREERGRGHSWLDGSGRAKETGTEESDED